MGDSRGTPSPEDMIFYRGDYRMTRAPRFDPAVQCPDCLVLWYLDDHEGCWICGVTPEEVKKIKERKRKLQQTKLLSSSNT